MRAGGARTQGRRCGRRACVNLAGRGRPARLSARASRPPGCAGISPAWVRGRPARLQRRPASRCSMPRRGVARRDAGSMLDIQRFPREYRRCSPWNISALFVGDDDSVIGVCVDMQADRHTAPVQVHPVNAPGDAPGRRQVRAHNEPFALRGDANQHVEQQVRGECSPSISLTATTPIGGPVFTRHPRQCAVGMRLMCVPERVSTVNDGSSEFGGVIVSTRRAMPLRLLSRQTWRSPWSVFRHVCQNRRTG
jgi:hypothetical protein